MRAGSTWRSISRGEIERRRGDDDAFVPSLDRLDDVVTDLFLAHLVVGRKVGRLPQSTAHKPANACDIDRSADR